MKTINTSIIFKNTIYNPNETNYTIWNIDIDEEDFEYLTNKYQNQGGSTYGTKEEIIAEVPQFI